MVTNENRTFEPMPIFTIEYAAGRHMRIVNVAETKAMIKLFSRNFENKNVGLVNMSR